MQTPAAALSSLTKPKQPPHSLLTNTKKGGGKSTLKSSACTLNRKNSAGEVHLRPLRERVMHLLALKPYKRPELFLRLQRDGLRAADKDELDSVLTEVIDHSKPWKMTFIWQTCFYSVLLTHCSFAFHRTGGPAQQQRQCFYSERQSFHGGAEGLAGVHPRGPAAS